MSIPSREVFERLQFVQDWSPTDQPPSYTADLGVLHLRAVRCLGMQAFLRPVFFLSGSYRTERTIGMINYEMPVSVASFEQGVAFLAYAVRDHVDVLKPVEWLRLGLDWSSHLPWNQSMAAYNARPQCTVRRNWFKLAAADLRAYASTSEPDRYVFVSFDGMVLTFDCGPMKVALPATGTAWEKAVAISVDGLLAIPKRIMRDPVVIGVWDDRFTIGPLGLPLVMGEDD
jgi:hypothetical protein